MSNWKFAESLEPDRLNILRNPSPFEDIARSIVKEMRVLCSHPDRCGKADGFIRIVACLVIDRPLFDLFFNSYNGYRGWYYRSPTDGRRINAQLLQLLAPQLAEYQMHYDMSNDWALKSLLACSAKCWLAEVNKGLCNLCEGDWSLPKSDEPEIINGRWDLSNMPYARFGRKAPYLRKLRVMGAFVNEAGEQYVVKPYRAEEIHEVGWS